MADINTNFEEELQKKLSAIFGNEEKQADEKLSEIISSVKDSVAAELNAIKINKEDIKREKTELNGKYQALKEQYASLEKDNAALNEKLKSSAPEEIQKVYDQKLADQTVIYERQLAEVTKDRDTYKQKADAAEKVQLQMECMQEFNKAIEGQNIAPDALSDFSAFVLGSDCDKFARKSIGDGMILANREGLTIKQAVERAKETTFGKRCMVVNSTGGGAEGAAWGKTPASQNPFLTGNVTEQARLFASDRDRYDKLKAEAAASKAR